MTAFSPSRRPKPSAPTGVVTTGNAYDSACPILPFMPAPKRSGATKRRLRVKNGVTSRTYPVTRTFGDFKASTACDGLLPTSVSITSGMRSHTIGITCSQSHFTASTLGGWW